MVILLSFRNYINIIIDSDETDGIQLDASSVTETLNSLGRSSSNKDPFDQSCWVCKSS